MPNLLILLIKILPQITIFQQLIKYILKVKAIKHKLNTYIIIDNVPKYVPKHQAKYVYYFQAHILNEIKKD